MNSKTEKSNDIASASVRLEGDTAVSFAAIRKHMTTVLPGLEPNNTDVLKNALAIAANALPVESNVGS